MKATTREKIKILVETAPNVDEADKLINEKYGFKTIAEKIAFLKGMFDVEIVNPEEDKLDEFTYWALLHAIIN